MNRMYAFLGGVVCKSTKEKKKSHNVSKIFLDSPDTYVLFMAQGTRKCCRANESLRVLIAYPKLSLEIHLK